MLLFLDSPKFIKVLRAGVNGEARAPVGVIPKNTFEMRDGATASLSPEEREEIREVVGGYREVAEIQRNLDVKRFPQIAREVAEYYVTGATALEKKQISAALVEALRAVRKTDHGAEPPRRRPAHVAPGRPTAGAGSVSETKRPRQRR